MIDPHAGDPPVSSPTNAATSAALDHIKSKSAPGTMATLSAALGSIATAIATAINNEAKQLQKIIQNKIAMTESLVKLPTTPDASAATKSVNTIIGNTVTADTVKLQTAMGAASTTPNPAAVGTFTTSMAEGMAAQSHGRIQSLTGHLAVVNGMKNTVGSKI